MIFVHIKINKSSRVKNNTLMGDKMSLIPSIRYSVSCWQYCSLFSFNVKNFSTYEWAKFIRSFLNHTLETTLLSNTSATTYDLTVMFSNRVLLLRKLMEKHDVNEKLPRKKLDYGKKNVTARVLIIPSNTSYR